MATTIKTPVATNAKAVEQPQFDWITLQADMDSAHPVETSREKMMRKINENPLVPVGCLATAAALSVGLWSLRSGNSKLSQTMMRLRIGAQGFTIVALVVGVVLTATKAAKK